MKTNRYLFIISIILFLVSSYSYAFQNEPDGFRGIKWGSTAGHFPDLRVYGDQRENNNLRIYTRENERLKIGDVTIINIHYYFYKNKFYEAIVDYHEKDRETLGKSLRIVYGKGKRESRLSLSKLEGDKLVDNYYWIGENVDVKIIKEGTALPNFGTDDTTVFGVDNSHISFTYKPISKQKNRDDQVRHDLQKANEKEKQLKEEMELRKKILKDL